MSSTEESSDLRLAGAVAEPRARREPSAQPSSPWIFGSRRLFQIIDTEPPVREPVAARSAPARSSLEVVDLGFSYPSSRGSPALRGITFSVPEGGRLAIVGPSGAGKSTLLRLAVTERQIMRKLQALLAGRTVILITHRLVELDWADEILVLDRGRVVERGTHQTLLGQAGLYRKLYDGERGG